MGQLNFQSSTTGCLWMFPWFLMRDGPTQVSINHNWLFMDVTMVPHKRWANSSFNHPQLVVYGCLPWFLMRDGPTQVSIIHNWLFLDVTIVPHKIWANSSFNHPQLVVYGCYHGSSWEMGQLKFQSTTTGCFMDVIMVPHERLDNYLKFQSTTTGCFWMLPWFLVRDVPTQSFNPPQLVYGCYHGS